MRHDPSRDRMFEAEQFVARPRDAVFAFFSDPRNLERITPPWLSFRIVARSTPDVREGTELTYRLKVRGLPMTWVSRITEWVPGERFADVQLRGPYAVWHHTHTFEDAPGGTWIRDRVVYRLPLGALGRLLAGRRVERDVREIFEHRQARTEVLLESAGGGAEHST